MVSETITIERIHRVYDEEGNLISDRSETQEITIDTVETINYGEGAYGEGTYGGGGDA